MARDDQIVWEVPTGIGEGRLRITVEGGALGLPIRIERHNEDVFFVAGDSRVIAAFVRMEAPATAAVPA